MPKIVILFGLMIIAVASLRAIETANSDAATAAFFFAFVALPALLVMGVVSAVHIVRSMRKGSLHWRTLAAGACLITAISYCANQALWHWLHPVNIRYTFDYGQSPTWHSVQFFHMHGKQNTIGPWIANSPLTVRFPDINGDGHLDIRVTGQKRIAEYLYLPQNDGKKYWSLLRNEGFEVSYPPDGPHGP